MFFYPFMFPFAYILSITIIFILLLYYKFLYYFIDQIITIIVMSLIGIVIRVRNCKMRTQFGIYLLYYKVILLRVNYSVSITKCVILS